MSSAESPFDNRLREEWENPFTGDTRTESFWDLLEAAHARVADAFRLFDAPDFDVECAHRVTHGFDFGGRPNA